MSSLLTKDCVCSLFTLYTSSISFNFNLRPDSETITFVNTFDMCVCPRLKRNGFINIEQLLNKTKFVSDYIFNRFKLSSTLVEYPTHQKLCWTLPSPYRTEIYRKYVNPPPPRTQDPPNNNIRTQLPAGGPAGFYFSVLGSQDR